MVATKSIELPRHFNVDCAEQMSVTLHLHRPWSVMSLALSQVGDGTVEFEPTPAESRSLIGSAYRVPYSLLVRFENDAIDETPEMSQILSSANPAGASAA